MEETESRGTAEREYLRRREERQQTLEAHTRRDLTVSRARTAVAAAAILLAWLAFGRHALSGWWLLAPTGIFVLLMALHERVLRGKRRAERAVELYDAGLRRIEHRWIGRGVTRNDFNAPDHPYATDLDLFGRGSVFDMLCRARTRVGQDCLAAWLLCGADAETVLERQEAVEELRSRLDFREEVALLGGDTEVDAGTLEGWGAAPIVIGSPWIRTIAMLLAAGGVASALAWWPIGIGPIPLIVVLAIGQYFLYRLAQPLARALRGVERSAPELAALSDLLARLEREQCASPLLGRLLAELAHAETTPSRQIEGLKVLVAWLNVQGSILFAPFARLLLWHVHFACAIERWRALNGNRLRVWLRVIGEFEALLSLASHAYEHPGDPFPELVANGPRFAAEGLGHPLLPAASAVRNDIALGDDVMVYVVSGSNMSGKSTLLRTVGVNTVLALAGAPVRATRLSLSPLQIGASLRTQDSLQAGVSRFYAEIVRLRQIVALAERQPPLLFLLDEILNGTNSHDRLVGGEAIARSLVRQGAIGLITTHDLALARIESDEALRAENVHFEDQLVGGKMSFDYHLRPGVVAKSNALELMRAVGLDV